MGRSYSRQKKGTSATQKQTLLKAQQTLAALRAGTPPQPVESIPQPSPEPPIALRLQQAIKKCKESAKKFWNERRKHHRFKGANEHRKGTISSLKKENSLLRGQLSKTQETLATVEKSAADIIAEQKLQLAEVVKIKHEAIQQQKRLEKRCRRFSSVKLTAIRSASTKALKKMQKFRITKNGVYTPEARAMARRLASLGTAEANVGTALQEMGKLVGVDIDRKMSSRTVGRATRELGVAADIQSAYEMAVTGKITYSSDSTSHRHIEYESRTISMPVIDYKNMSGPPQWCNRTLGIGTSVDHTSETQVQGLKDRLGEICRIFNESPLAKRMKMTFTPDDFARKLRGSSGDHASDQKKSHGMLEEWRMDVILQRMGEEAMHTLETAVLMPILIQEKVHLVNEAGSYDAWMALSDEEKDESNRLLYRAIGKKIFDDLISESERKNLTRFIRTGCCMHKDLNTFKGGDKEMREMWTKLGKTPPILLANKDNTAVLERCGNPDNPTPLEKRALDASKRGGTHTTTLGGMICRNKDTKKGQQQTYTWYMESHVKRYVAYPDVSNTRYGTHGEAAAVLVLYRDHFISFMENVRDGKDKPGFTNIEKNFYNALNDTSTFTELCVLALYCLCVSRPFMVHVRRHENILDLQDFFQKKSAFLRCISDKPTIWSLCEDTHVTASLDGQSWDEWTTKVIMVIRGYAPLLPDLNNAISAFALGALTTFTERFSDEFQQGGAVDTMSSAERGELFFSSTNDENEGALGSFRLGQRARPAETLHKFNAAYMGNRNNTEEFILAKLTEEEDMKFLRMKERQRNASGLQRQIKQAQVEADAAKVKKNRARERVRTAKRVEKAARLVETGNNLVLVKVDIVKLQVPALDRQLDYHRDLEKHIPKVDGVERVPIKAQSGKKRDKIEHLLKAVERYNARLQEAPAVDVEMVDVQDSEEQIGAADPQSAGDELYLSDHNDDGA